MWFIGRWECYWSFEHILFSVLQIWVELLRVRVSCVVLLCFPSYFCSYSVLLVMKDLKARKGKKGKKRNLKYLSFIWSMKMRTQQPREAVEITSNRLKLYFSFVSTVEDLPYTPSLFYRLIIILGCNTVTQFRLKM